MQLGYDKNGDGINEFVPARAANGAVIVTGTDPTTGIPFWEDVTIAAGSRNFRSHLQPPRRSCDDRELPQYDQ